MDWSSLLILISIGAASGLFGALLGVGGGLLVIPVLHLVFDLPMPLAIGTSLVSVVLTTLVASRSYLARGLVDLPAATHLAFGSLIGAYVGSHLIVRVPETVLSVAFSAVVLTAAWRLAFRRRRDAEATAGAPSGIRRRATAFLLSPFAGALAGLLGVGGGFLQLPLLRLISELDLRQVIATNALIVTWIASVASAVHWSQGHVVGSILPPLLAGSALGALAGPAALMGIPQRRVELLLGTVLAVVALRMLWR